MLWVCLEKFSYAGAPQVGRGKYGDMLGAGQGGSREEHKLEMKKLIVCTPESFVTTSSLGLFSFAIPEP